jgi:hypothetical protein
MQQWEYHIVMRTRQIGRAAVNVRDIDRATQVTSDFHPDGPATLAEMQRLGREGWELVGISTRASLLNSPMTSEELWVFKRPLSQS